MTTTSRRPGRPARAGVRSTRCEQFHTTDAEHAAIAEYARRRGQPVADVLRLIVLSEILDELETQQLGARAQS